MTTHFTWLCQIILNTPRRAALKVCQGPACRKRNPRQLPSLGKWNPPQSWALLVSMEMLAPCRLGSWGPWGLGERREGFCSCFGGADATSQALSPELWGWERGQPWSIMSYISSFKCLLCVQPCARNRANDHSYPHSLGHPCICVTLHLRFRHFRSFIHSTCID